MSEDFWKSCKLQYLILVTFLVLAGLAGGLVVSLPSRAEIPSLGEKPVTMDFRDVDLKDAIGTLSVMTGWNMIVDKDVQGKVNVRFKDVPALQILSEILEINECQYEIEDNIIKVSRMPILNQSLLLEYALVSSVAPYLDALLSSEGSFQLDEATNTIVLSDKKKNLEKIAAFIADLDTPAKQLQSKNFAVEFIPVDSVVFLLEDYLSAEGKIEVDPLANTLLLTETSRNFTQLEELLLNIDVYRAIEEMFTLRYALASSIAPLLENYLGPEDKLQLNEQTNEIILSSDLYTLKKIGILLDSLDTPAKQIQSKSFTVKYLYLEELASIVEENLSSLGRMIEANQDRSMLVIEDTSYNLSRIEKLVQEIDIFTPVKKTYEIKFAPLAFLAEQVDGLLSDKGVLEIKEETFRFTVVDVKKNLDRIDALVKKEDILQRQLISPVQFEEESLKNVLSLFSDEVRINMFVSPEVEGKVSLRLAKPTPFLEALEAVLTQNYCQYEIKDSIITVSKIPLFSRSFSLEYALASSIAFSANIPISSEGSLHLDEATNTIIVEDKEEKIEEISAFIADLDTPEKQRQSKSFSIKFLPVGSVASLLGGSLSAEGQIEVDSSTNTLLLTETSRNFAKLEELIVDLDVYRAKEKIFTLKYALASTLTSSIDVLLSSEGSFQLDDATNTIIVSDRKEKIEEIAAFIAEWDTPARQLQSKSFSIKFLPVGNVASLLEGYLSAEGEIKVDLLANTLLLTETSRNFAKLDERIISLDVYQPKKEIFTLEYVLPSAVRSLLMNYLGPKDSFEIDEQTNEIILNSDPYTSRKIRGLLDSLDTLETQLIEETYSLKYLTPQEAWDKLKFKNTVSKHASYEGGHSVGRERSVEKKEVEQDYVRIPREIVDNSETESVRAVVSSSEENMKDKQSVGYISITDLKRNQQRIKEAIEEMNRGEEIINRTFYIGEGSLERMALAMANILGINPEDIEGLEPKGEWMKIEVPTPEINLGTLGPR